MTGTGDSAAARIVKVGDGQADAKLAAHLETAEWHLRRIIEIARTVQPLDLADTAEVEQAVVDESSKLFARTAARVQRHADRAQHTLDVLAENAAAIRWEAAGG